MKRIFKNIRINKKFLKGLSILTAIKLIISIIVFTLISINAKSQVINSVDTAYYGANIQFAINTGNIASQKWYFGDGDSSNISTTYHIYTPSSCGFTTFNLVLSITDSSNYTSIHYKTIVIKNLPSTPSLSDIDLITPYSNCDQSPSISNPNFTIHLNNSTQDTSNISYYQINWGDNNSSNSISNTGFPVSHTYQQLGLFNCAITAYNTNGCSLSTTYEVANQSNPALGLSTLGSTQGCSPQEFTFILSQYQTNSPGTYYVWNFGDGSPNITWNFNAPYFNDSIKHIFNTSSCNSTNNSFTVSVTAYNFCDQTTATVSNIRIYTKPTANFSSSLDTSCTNTSINFSNNTLSGFGYNCNGNANYLWDFGDGTSSNSTNAIHSYNNIGNYTVKLTATNGVCGSSVDSLNIIVNKIPKVIGAISQSIACDSLIVSTMNWSTGGNLKYNWTIIPSVGWHFLSGYSASDKEPKILFDSLGIYTLKLTSSNKCGTDDSSFTITIMGKPDVNLSTIADFCGSATINPSANINLNFSNSSSYLWSFIGSSISSTNIQSPNNIIYSNTGTYNIILKVSNQCGIDSSVTSFTIHNLPAVNLTAASNSICFGDSISLFASGAFSYQWTANQSLLNTSLSQILVNPISSTTYILKGTDIHQCVNYDTLNLIVNNLPSVIGNASNTSFCNGDSVTLTANGALSYLWKMNGSNIGNQQIISILPNQSSSIIVIGTDTNSCKSSDTINLTMFVKPSITLNSIYPQICQGNSFNLIASGASNISINPATTVNSNGNFILSPSSSCIYTITASNLTSCSSDTIIHVTVLNLPNVNITSNSSNICAGDTFTLSGNGAVNYEWYNSAGVIISQNANLNYLPTTSGSIVLEGEDVNGCENNDTLFYTVFPLPQITINSSSNSICVGDSVLLNASGAVSYNWLISNQIIGNSSNLVQIPISSTTYKVVGTDQNSCSNLATQLIVVNQLPILNATLNNSQMCFGDSVYLSLSGAVNYSLNSVNISANKYLKPTITSIYNVIGTDIHNCTDTTTFSIKVNSLPTIAINSTAQSICLGQSVQLNASGASQYSWNPASNLNTAFGNQVIATPNQSAIFTVQGTDSLGCKNQVSISIMVSNSLNIQVNASSSSICYGDTVSLIASGANTYQWISGNGLLSQTGNQVNAFPNSTSNYVVTGIDTMGCISTNSVNVVVNQLPNIVIASSNQSICLGDSVSLSASGAAQYEWVFPNNSSIFSNSIVEYPQIGTTYQVKGTDTNLCSNYSSVFISINPNPVIQATSNNSSVCSGGNFILTASGGSLYQWSPQNLVSTPNSNSTLATPSQSAWIYLNGSNSYGCTAIDSIYLTVNPLPIFTLSPSSVAICVGDSALISASGNYQYSWTPANGISNNFGNSIKVSPLNSINYTATATDSNLCSITKNILVTVNSLPTASISMDTVACSNVAVNIVNQSYGATQFFWSFGDNTTSNLQNPSHSYSSNGFYEASLVAINSNNCTDTVKNEIHIISVPTATFTSYPQIGCSPLNVFINNNSTVSNGSYSWNFGNGNYSSNANPNNILFNSVDGHDTTFIIHLSLANICGTSNYSDTITVNTKPISNFGYVLNSQCSPATANFGNISSSNATSFSWNLGDNTFSNSQVPQNHIYSTGSTVSTFPVSMIASNQCGSDTSIKYISVNPNYVNAIFTPSQINACAPANINFTNYSNIQNSALWNFGDGNVSSQINPTHVYSAAGNYNVSLIVTDNCGIDTANITINVGNSPQLSFSTSNDTICQFSSVSFNNLTSNLTNLQWNFGDSITSTLNSLSHTYQSFGNKLITFIGEDANSNCTDTISKIIVVNPSAKAIISVDTLDGCYPLTVNFQSQSINSTFFRWNFADGNTSVSQNIQHTFLNPNNYNVQLVADNYFGCKDTTYTIIKSYPRPQANFTFINTNPCEYPAKIKFINNSIGAVGYSWNFDNGDSSKINDPIVSYSNSGNYHPTLIALNAYNCSDTLSNTLSLLSTPKANFTIDNTIGCEGINIQFTNYSTDAQYYKWLIDYNFISSLNSPLLTFTSEGKFISTLIAINSAGCSDTNSSSDTIIIHPRAVADFNFEQVSNTENNEGIFQFTNLSDKADFYSWQFDDGDSSNAINPQHRFYTHGDYNITLYATNKYNCSNQISKNLSVDLLKGLFIPSALAPNHPNPDVRLFTPKGNGLKSYHIAIYDSWGNIIWESTQLINGQPAESWNGSVDRKELPLGTYFWQAVAVFEDGSIWQGQTVNGTTSRQGSLTLLR
ncbi:MAG: hypothetical protein AUJ98_07280 [Bacteroidetes bacterium CG2_30_33_31]|nr:MAG: hypothetical protein AUJ98_07280 [Bacteroidetes bacterium CG2_30_33_31]